MNKLLSVLIMILITLTFGCGTGIVKTKPDLKSGYIFYPPLPNNPKYQYLTTFSTSLDIKIKKSKFFKFVAGKDQEKPEPIKKAYGVDVYKGIIYVCDFGVGSVVTLDLINRSFKRIGISGQGKLIQPINLTIDRSAKIIYVADAGKKQIMTYDLEGKFLQAYGIKGQFINPVDVAVANNKIFICDVKKHSIHVLDSNTGKQLYNIGTVGSENGELFHPTNIDIFDNKLYVSDTNNYRIQIFDLKGKHLKTFGRSGDRPGEFSRGKGIAVDREGRVYVVDAAVQNVQVFNKEDRLLLFMFGPGGEKHNINLPAAVCVNYDSLKYFKKYLSPKFKAEYLLLVTSNFGLNKVNVYAFGSYIK